MCLFLDILIKIYRLMLLTISSISCVNKDFFEKFENSNFYTLIKKIEDSFISILKFIW